MRQATDQIPHSSSLAGSYEEVCGLDVVVDVVVEPDVRAGDVVVDVLGTVVEVVGVVVVGVVVGVVVVGVVVVGAAAFAALAFAAAFAALAFAALAMAALISAVLISAALIFAEAGLFFALAIFASHLAPTRWVLAENFSMGLDRTFRN